MAEVRGSGRLGAQSQSFKASAGLAPLFGVLLKGKGSPLHYHLTSAVCRGNPSPEVPPTLELQSDLSTCRAAGIHSAPWRFSP